ncbi:MAG TPA: glycosyltransferase [Terriglobales bacterium]|nr:glycosyltransferase [Terriglobales bacterium]
MLALAASGAVSALIWAYMLLGRGRFWHVSRTQPVARELTRRVAVVVPARNEAAVIAQSLESLLPAAGDSLHVYLVDDGSSDGTAQIARNTAASLAKLDSLTILEGQPLPPGWSGKLWAVSQGIAAARFFRPEFILLTDADIVHSAGTIGSLVAIAENSGYDLVSFMAKLHCRSIVEKLLIPAFVFFFFMLYPPAWTVDVRRATAGAAGGCLLIRPQALDRIGGIEAIRGEIIDDCALARAVKRSGGKIWLGPTEASASIRPYGSFAEIGRMISRTAFNQLRHSTVLLLGTVVGLAVTYLLPPGLLFSGHAVPIILGVIAWALMTISYSPMVRLYRLNPLWALTLPLAAVFYMGATIHSAAKYWLGRGGEWKGRAQDRGHPAIHSQ